MIGRILYGSLFCIALPLLLIAWASKVTIDLPPVDWLIQGWMLFVVGVVTMLTAMHNLYYYGKGLPMNAYPPKLYVTRGAYGLVKHPIYVGFCLICAGVSCIAGSSTGLFLVTPVVALLCVALVYGYEGPDIEKRFGALSKNTSVTALIPLFVGWVLGYEALIQIGYQNNFIDTSLWFEKNWPVIEMAEIPYALTYIVFIAPFFARSESSLQSYISLATFMVIAGLFLQFILPFYCSPRPFVSTTIPGDFILFERSADGPAAAFPSFHAIWILITAWFLVKEFPRYRIVVVAIATVMLWSCIANGAHSVLDITGAVLLFLAGINRENIWTGIQRTTERVANSWTSVRIGRMRIINHAIFSALAAFTGVMITGQFIHDVILIALIVICSLLGAMLWGQWVEGSAHMLRPLGYFGSILGGLIGIGLVGVVTEVSATTAMAAIALAAPWTQAIGRLRCLVQGCCHGRPSGGWGIRYINPHSRVHANAALIGRTLHNTQLYSIALNVIVGLVLARLKFGGAPDTLIAGLYFILSGTSRFVEEAYRGESQTTAFGGLKIYQWLSIASILFGCVISTLAPTIMLPASPDLSLQLIATALVAALAWAFGMSMDFPESNARFARLTG